MSSLQNPTPFSLHPQISQALGNLSSFFQVDRAGIGSLHQGLIGIGQQRFKEGFAGGVFDAFTRYSQELTTQNIGLQLPLTIEGLLDDFAGFLTRSLEGKKQETELLEGEMVEAVRRHGIFSLPLESFEKTPDDAISIAESYLELMTGFKERIRTLQKEVYALDESFYDSNDVIRETRSIIHVLNNNLFFQEGKATLLIKSCRAFHEISQTADIGDERIESAREKMRGYLESLHATFNDEIDPFHYIRIAYSPTVKVERIRRVLRLREPQILRRILDHLIQNALKAGADDIRVSILPVPNSNSFITVAVLDNGPGILAEKRGRIFREKFDSEGGSGGNGLYLVFHDLIPRLGEGASISFVSPVETGRGTLMRIVVPTLTTDEFRKITIQRGNEAGKDAGQASSEAQEIMPESALSAAQTYASLDDAIRGAAMGMTGREVEVSSSFDLTSGEPRRARKP